GGYSKGFADHSRSTQPVSTLPSTESSALVSPGKTVCAARCASCHGAQGEGKPPHWPPLAGNQSIEMESAVNPIRMVLNGGYPPSTAGNPKPYGMPPFPGPPSDNQVAAVVPYIRTSWGNRGPAVSARDANQLRSASLD